MNPPRKARFPVAPDDWLKHAASDLKLGNLGRDQDVLPEQLCFHAQQATEKALTTSMTTTTWGRVSHGGYRQTD